MKQYPLILFLCLISIILASCTSSPTPTIQGKALCISSGVKGETLIFDDEFNCLDKAKWSIVSQSSPPNHEVEHYIPGNVSVVDGKLVLTGKKDTGGMYTSGEISGKFSFTYGRVEIRAKMPRNGQGIWPALWLLGDKCNIQSCNWPAQGANEIDIAEQINEPHVLHMNAHYGIVPHVDIGSHGCTYRSTIDYSADYHVFSLLWQQGGNLTWYIDGVQQCQRKNPGYFDTPMHIMLNIAIGGWPGNPDLSTPFPQYLSIDYVRVYQ